MADDDTMADTSTGGAASAGSAAAAVDDRAPIFTSKKGRGGGAIEAEDEAEERYAGRAGVFESLETEEGAGPQQCELGLPPPPTSNMRCAGLPRDHHRFLAAPACLQPSKVGSSL